MKRLLLIILFCVNFWIFGFNNPVQAEVIRIMSANTTSGNNQSYDPGEGIRIFEGLKPDIVLIQEWNYKDNTQADIREFVDEVFGTEFSYFREINSSIPNGVISRFPIIESGEWDDNEANNRDFAFARIDVPGDVDLSVVSIHFLNGRGASARRNEAEDLISDMEGIIPQEDYLVIGGDFNTDNHNELALRSLNRVVITKSPYPVDRRGNANTNASRAKPYDGVYVDLDLAPHEVPVNINENSFPNGLVFDSRVYEPLEDVSPVMRGDSGARQMQHMAVIRDFEL